MSSPSSNTLRVNDAELFYVEAGVGTPLLLIHGGTVTHESWAAHIPHYVQQHRVIAPDSRGHGRSTNPRNEIMYRLMADDMVALISALKLDKPFVCGYSDGGQIALEMALHYPGIARGYVLAGTVYCMDERYRSMMPLMGLNGVGQVDTDKMMRDNLGWVEFMQQQHDPHHYAGYWKDYMTQLSHAWLTVDYALEQLTQITDPCLILQGDRDELVSVSQGTDLYATIPGAELAIVPAAGHMQTIENVALFTQITLEFFARHTR
jgi:pimeloyl-ACP methyl ester carboxylesterase